MQKYFQRWNVYENFKNSATKLLNLNRKQRLAKKDRENLGMLLFSKAYRIFVSFQLRKRSKIQSKRMITGTIES